MESCVAAEAAMTELPWPELVLATGDYDEPQANSTRPSARVDAPARRFGCRVEDPTSERLCGNRKLWGHSPVTRGDSRADVEPAAGRALTTAAERRVAPTSALQYLANHVFGPESDRHDP
jgi:hypothetical protein